MKKIAIIQESPYVLDKERTIGKAVEIINSVSDQGAKLIVFPEAFIPGYPAWIWRLRPGGDWGICEELHVRLLKNSVDLSSDDLKPMLAAANDKNVTVVCGINERDNANSQSTIYNSVITIDAQGKIVNHHRKLMPTNPERMVWGFGDGHGLNVIDTPVGRIGSLRKQRTSPKRPWRTGLFVIEAMVTGGLVARRKPLTKSTNYPVRPEGWISKRSTPLSERL